MAMSRRDAGRLGGLQTYLRYGAEAMRERGKRGGRPRLPTLEQIRQQQAPMDKIELKGGMAAYPNNLRVLKELWKLRNKEREGLLRLES